MVRERPVGSRVPDPAGLSAGDEVDAALGGYYEGLRAGKRGRITPLLQLLGSMRQHDTGVNADPPNSGYVRFLLSPGIEYDIDRVRLYGDVEVQVYQDVNGNQLIAPVQLKLIVAYQL